MKGVQILLVFVYTSITQKILEPLDPFLSYSAMGSGQYEMCRVQYVQYYIIMLKICSAPYFIWSLHCTAVQCSAVQYITVHWSVQYIAVYIVQGVQGLKSAMCRDRGKSPLQRVAPSLKSAANSAKVARVRMCGVRRTMLAIQFPTFLIITLVAFGKQLQILEK